MNLSASLAIVLLLVGPCVGCTTGDVRLTSRPNGTLQICRSNEWKYVCSNDWGHLEAAVACRQLGYDGGLYTQSIRPSNSAEMDKVYHRCNGQENTLKNCVSVSYSSCSRGANISCVRRNNSDPCSRGDIRLWGGETVYEGNIEICTDHGVWSAVCDNNWDNIDAIVACKQLGYTNSIAVPYSNSAFGQRIQPIEFGGLDCTGTESSLLDCTVSSSFVRTWSQIHFCNQGDYSGVKCIPRSTAVCTSGDIRLANGYSPNNGFPEMCIEGAWIGLCPDRNRQPSTVISNICKHLGYPRYTWIEESFFPSNKSEPMASVSLDESRCSATSSLVYCVRHAASYGVMYRAPCTVDGILCCPNDVTMCSFQPRSPMDPTTPPTNTQPTTNTNQPTNQQPTTTDPITEQKLDSPIIWETTGKGRTKGNHIIRTSPTYNRKLNKDESETEFSLDFGTTATSLISSFGDLRGLEEDIQNRIIKDISVECNCPFDTSALEGGYFSFGDSVTYHSKVFGVAGQSADKLVIMLKRSIEKDPLIQYRNGDIYLAVTLFS